MRLILTFSLTLLTSVSYAQLFYKYVDKDGVNTVSTFITPENAAKGYQIVDEKGWLIEEVAPALTAAEREAQAAQQRLERMREERDSELMKLYNSPESVDRALKNAVGRIEVTQSIKRSVMVNRKSRLVSAQSDAADYERTKREIPANILEMIKGYEQEISDLEIEIEQLENEKKGVEQVFMADRARVEFLRAREDAKLQALLKGKGSEVLKALDSVQTIDELRGVDPEIGNDK